MGDSNKNTSAKKPLRELPPVLVGGVQAVEKAMESVELERPLLDLVMEQGPLIMALRRKRFTWKTVAILIGHINKRAINSDALRQTYDKHEDQIDRTMASQIVKTLDERALTRAQEKLRDLANEFPKGRRKDEPVLGAHTVRGEQPNQVEQPSIEKDRSEAFLIANDKVETPSVISSSTLRSTGDQGEGAYPLTGKQKAALLRERLARMAATKKS